jgi:hypothetical protein
MIKKIFVALVITVVLGAGVFGLVKSTFAQNVDTDEVETTAEPVLQGEEFEYQYQNGECTGECTGDGDQTQTQLRQQLHLNDGTCDGTCTGDQLQTRLGGQNGAGAGQGSNSNSGK